MSGWIKLRRSLKDWEWYDDINTTRLLIHLLISVNFEDKKWRGIDIKAGSMVFSWESLSNASGLSKQQCRTSMAKLIKCKEVTSKATNRFSLVTLLKWDKIQLDNKQVTSKPTNKQQTSNKQVTTTKESKEYKELKEDKKMIFFSWISYRKEIKKEIKSIATLKSLVKKFNAEDLKKCEHVVNNSIENNYQGLFWDNYKPKQINKPNKPTF